MARRVCIFCGRSPVTNEHVIPRWVAALILKDPRAKNLPRPIDHQLRGDTRLVTWRSDRIDVRAKCVCRDCNQGWMSRIEDDAQAFIRPMIMGQHISLDADAQRRVATWVALRALVFRHLAEGVIPADEEWRKQFYDHRSPPDTCYQWIIAYDGSQPFYYAGNDITVSFDTGNPTDPGDTPHGILMILAVGYFAVKVLWIRKGEPNKPPPPGLLRAWPASSTPILWPQKTLNDEGLLQLQVMFLA